ACYQASLVGGSKGGKLRELCRGHDLSDAARWKQVQALGAAILKPGATGYEGQRDIIGCLATERARGLTWRNSDPMICGRVTRASAECKCDYVDIPTSVDGFAFTGWTNDSLPTGCRYAKVGGAAYPQIVICDVSQSEIDDLDANEAWRDNLR